ncbi:MULTISPECIES: DNA/RNA non-specific endonuclease [unclassified Empedobacter]|uniref:DNA/RNA non-specific endonuclease n=1 Tax=unclassified Empedobacter TaxID=2643773 RepID=UPI0025BFD5DC|nr:MULTISPECIES: DNA/RNA non-specific endonuclease [unclassified Empedobacter]
MKVEFNMEGYCKFFLGDSYEIDYPKYTHYNERIAINKDTKKHVLNYLNYSVIQCGDRRLPLFTASNIYRINFERIDRKGTFKKESRIEIHEQLSTLDYKSFNSIKKAVIEKGHMTKREDVQWSYNSNRDDALNAAISTFFYTNACPQHDSINNGPWKHLENSIIVKGRVKDPHKVSVFTGPVLSDLDPEFKSRLHDSSIFQIPVIFWKIIYYVKDDNLLYYAGFLMGQKELLKNDDLIDIINFRDFDAETQKLKPFLTFKDDYNYQVPIKLIEELTKLQFVSAIDRHADVEYSELDLVEIKSRNFEDEVNDDEFMVENLMV